MERVKPPFAREQLDYFLGKRFFLFQMMQILFYDQLRAGTRVWEKKQMIRQELVCKLCVTFQTGIVELIKASFAIANRLISESPITVGIRLA